MPLVGAMMLPMLFGSVMGIGATPAMGPMQVISNRAAPVQPIPPEALISGVHRKQLTLDKYYHEMAGHGISKLNATRLMAATRPLLDTLDAISLYRRGLLGSEQKKQQGPWLEAMRKLGWHDETSQRMLQATEVLPTPQQLVVFLVREVLNKDLRKKLELDAEYPEEADDEFRRVGIQPRLARQIWAAHWQLPSITQLALAYHRYRPERRDLWQREVTDMGLDPDRVATSTEDIMQLLKYMDVGTAYRQQVMSTLYAEPGRIELRWLIRFRFLTYQEAVYRYERKGLPRTLASQLVGVVFCVQSTPDWARAISKGAMTWQEVESQMDEWHVTQPQVRRVVRLKVAPDTLETLKPERDLTRSLILDGYETGVIDRQEAKNRLQELGYDDESSSFIVEVHDADNQRKRAKAATGRGLTKAETKKAYREGVIPYSQAQAQLQELGMTPEATTIILDSIRVKTDAK